MRLLFSRRKPRAIAPFDDCAIVKRFNSKTAAAHMEASRHGWCTRLEENVDRYTSQFNHQAPSPAKIHTSVAETQPSPDFQSAIQRGFHLLSSTSSASAYSGYVMPVRICPLTPHLILILILTRTVDRTSSIRRQITYLGSATARVEVAEWSRFRRGGNRRGALSRICFRRQGCVE